MAAVAFGLVAVGFAPTAGAQTSPIESTVDDDVIEVNEVIELSSTPGAGDFGISSSGANADIDVNDGGVIRTVDDETSASSRDAGGIVSLGANADIDVNAGGLVETSGERSRGIQIRGANTEVTVAGTIETEGERAPGIFSQGNNAVITVSGTIRTEGDRGFAIQAAAGDAPVIHLTREGRLITSGFRATGIESASNNAVIMVDGMIETSGEQGHGISAGAGANDVTINFNAGARIVTTGDGAYGIWYGSGDDPEITVAGSIQTSGVSSYGVASLGRRTRITIVDTIETSGVSANGINVFPSLVGGVPPPEDSVITIAEGALVKTTGDGALGIWSQGARARIMIAGTLETTGGVFVNPSTSRTSRANGIIAIGAGTAVTVDGTVKTAGAEADAIWSIAAGNTITVNAGGLVKTTGEDARAIVSQVSPAVITMDGTIETSGQNAHGILAVHGGETITVGGRIETTGVGAAAIFGLAETPEQTVRLLPTARVYGSIQNVGTVRVEGFQGHQEPSRAMILRNIVNPVEIMVGGGTQPVFQYRSDDFDMLVALDPTASAMQRNALADVTHLIHGAVFDQSTLGRSAPDSAAAGDLRRWAIGIGGDFERDDDGGALGWDGDVYGVVGGVERLLDNGIRLGILGAYARGEYETDVQSMDVDTKSIALGVYGRHEDRTEGSSYDLTGSFLGGYNDIDVSRRALGHVGGPQGAAGSPKGWFASASIGAKFYRPISEKQEFRPSVRVDGVIARHRSYAESGAGDSNLRYDSWTSASATARAQLAFATQTHPTTEVETRIGATARLHADDDLTARLVRGGNSVNYDVPGDDSVLGGFVGARLTSVQSDRFFLVADGEYGRGSDDEEVLSLRLQLSASF